MKTETLNIRLPLEHIRAVDRIAELAGASRSAVLSVILATHLLTHKPKRKTRRTRK